MEGKEQAMLERHDRELEEHRKLFNEHKELFNEHKKEIEHVKSEQLKQVEIVNELKFGVREINGTVNSLASSVGELRHTIVSDSEKTRSYFEQAFTHIMGVKEREQQSNTQLTMAKLSTKEKIVLGAISLLGSGGFLVGLAGFFAR